MEKRLRTAFTKVRELYSKEITRIFVEIMNNNAMHSVSKNIDVVLLVEEIQRD